MAIILNDTEIQKLIGTVIIDGDPASVRPNSYVLRLGKEGEFLNAGKDFSLGDARKGVRISPGHSVALTALETIDFRPETVEKIYPGCALHALISPTTDLSREGIVAATTQIDAGYRGTLNWTITNTSNQERRFLYRERLFRLTILKLETGEVPLKYYEGEYQGQTGYVRSQRKGAPTGMRDTEWVDSVVEGGPEALLDNLMKSGYPWHALGQRLKEVDQQFKVVSNEYAEIHDSLRGMRGEMDGLARQYASVMRSLPETVGKVLSEQATSLQNRWLLVSGSMIIALLGLIISIASSEWASGFVKANGPWIGLIMMLLAVITVVVVGKRARVKRP